MDLMKTLWVSTLLAAGIGVASAQDDDLDFLFEDAPAQESSSGSEPPASDAGSSSAAQAQSENQPDSEPVIPKSEPSRDAAAPTVDTSPDNPDQQQAQREPPGTTARGSRSRLVEEIVVTAQKREENIQDVPIAITAFSPEKLDALGIDSAQDLERVTPGLTVTNAAGFNVVFLRGVGTDAFLPGADPSVPFYVDGVALLGAQGTSDTLGRVKRVEVLKGPQGTLFGRNSTGGAINIITPDPTDEFSGDLKVEVGRFGERNVLGFLNVPIIDGLAATISGYNNEHDNYYTNEVGPLLDVFSRGGRAKIRWETTDDLAFTLAGSYSESSGNGGLTFENTRTAPLAGAFLPEDPEADRRVRLDSTPGATNEGYLISAQVDWKLPLLDIKVIGSNQELEAPFVQADFDKSELPIVNIQSIEQLSKQDTIEVQFLSNDSTPFSDRFEWVAGFYFLKNSGGFDPIAFEIGPNPFGAFGVPNGNALTDAIDSVLQPITGQNLSDGFTAFNAGVLASESYSGYVQGTFGILESLDLTLGARYQVEDRDLLRSRLSVPDGQGGERVLRRDNVPTLEAEQFSPKIALQWRPFGPGAQIYAGWARGFKSPTYNTVNLVDDPEAIEEEQVDSYELGFKSDLFGAALRLNAAVFFINQENLLTGNVALASGGVVTFENAGNAQIRGAEVDFLWTPMPELNPGLALTGAASYLDTEYTDFDAGRGFDDDTGLAFGEGSITGQPGRNFEGNRIVRTPEFTYTAGINQSFPLGPGTVEIGVDTLFNSGFFFQAQNTDLGRREEYQTYDARISYFYDPWGLQLTAFGENLTDEEYNAIVFIDDFGRNQVLNAPRIYGLRAKYSF